MTCRSNFARVLRMSNDLFGGELLPLLGQEHHGVPSFVRLHPDKALLLQLAQGGIDGLPADAGDAADLTLQGLVALIAQDVLSEMPIFLAAWW